VRRPASLPPQLAHWTGLLVDCLQLALMAAAILIAQLAAMVPWVRRLMASMYDRLSRDTERVEAQAAAGLISLEQRGRHYVFKSIDFEDFLRSVSRPAYLRTRFNWWRQRRQWEADAPLGGVAAGQPVRDGPLLRLSDGQSMQLSDLLRPGRFLLLNFGSCT
jgi:hypothetical protein